MRDLCGHQFGALPTVTSNVSHKQCSFRANWRATIILTGVLTHAAGGAFAVGF